MFFKYFPQNIKIIMFLNLFKKNKIPTFKEYLKKEHPKLYSSVDSRFSNHRTTEEAMHSAIEYYIKMLKDMGEFPNLTEVNFLLEEGDEKQ